MDKQTSNSAEPFKKFSLLEQTETITSSNTEPMSTSKEQKSKIDILAELRWKIILKNLGRWRNW